MEILHRGNGSKVDVSSYTLVQEIQNLDVDIINVHINSYGGEVAEGLAIYNMLKNHKAKIVTICDGFGMFNCQCHFYGRRRTNNERSLTSYDPQCMGYGQQATLMSLERLRKTLRKSQQQVLMHIYHALQ